MRAIKPLYKKVDIFGNHTGAYLDNAYGEDFVLIEQRILDKQTIFVKITTLEEIVAAWHNSHSIAWEELHAEGEK